MITLHKLKLFMVVYDRGSLNKAAQELYLAQSAVSQHIQSLESDLGTPLFERSARGVRPTHAGELLYDYARRILQLLNDAERDIMNLNRAETHQLAVGSTPGVSVYLLPMWLQQFQQTHPHVSVSLQTVLTIEVVRDVLSGRYQLGFLEGDLDELDQEPLGKMRLYDIEYLIMVTPQHPWASRTHLSISELVSSELPFINRQPGSRTRRWLDQTLGSYGIHLRSIAELDSPGAIKYALLNEMGAAILPRYVIERETERGELHALTLDEVSLKRPLMLVWDKRLAFSPIQRAFISLLSRHAPQLQILL